MAVCEAINVTMKASGVAKDLVEQNTLVYCASFPNGPGGAIHGYRLDPASGRLTAVHHTRDIENPFFLILSRCGNVLYSVHAPGKFAGPEHSQIAAYKLAGRDRVPRLLKRQSTHGAGACYLSLSASGKTLLVANYASGSLASIPLDRDGSPREAASIIGAAHAGSEPEPQTQSHPHCIVTSADDRFAIIADLGLDQIQSYRFDAVTHRLASSSSSVVALTTGSGPRHLVFAREGEHGYVINELRSTITLFDYDKQTGDLSERHSCSTLPDGYDGENAAADIVLAANGRHMYACNRGHDSIAAYCIADDGVPDCIEITSSHGHLPQSLAISPCGSFLLCANSGSGCIVVFRIDAVTGTLSTSGQSIALPFPSCLAIC